MVLFFTQVKILARELKARREIKKKNDEHKQKKVDAAQFAEEREGSTQVRWGNRGAKSGAVWRVCGGAKGRGWVKG